jgi:hypothetical protein
MVKLCGADCGRAWQWRGVLGVRTCSPPSRCASFRRRVFFSCDGAGQAISLLMKEGRENDHERCLLRSIFAVVSLSSLTFCATC